MTISGGAQKSVIPLAALSFSSPLSSLTTVRSVAKYLDFKYCYGYQTRVVLSPQEATSFYVAVFYFLLLSDPYLVALPCRCLAACLAALPAHASFPATVTRRLQGHTRGGGAACRAFDLCQVCSLSDPLPSDVHPRSRGPARPRLEALRDSVLLSLHRQPKTPLLLYFLCRSPCPPRCSYGPLSACPTLHALRPPSR